MKTIENIIPAYLPTTTDGQGGQVDRTYEFAEPDNEVVVTLKDGHTERFWVKGDR